jgi:hypothetical protein
MLWQHCKDAARVHTPASARASKTGKADAKLAKAGTDIQAEAKTCEHMEMKKMCGLAAQPAAADGIRPRRGRRGLQASTISQYRGFPTFLDPLKKYYGF